MWRWVGLGLCISAGCKKKATVLPVDQHETCDLLDERGIDNRISGLTSDHDELPFDGHCYENSIYTASSKALDLWFSEPAPDADDADFSAPFYLLLTLPADGDSGKLIAYVPLDVTTPGCHDLAESKVCLQIDDKRDDDTPNDVDWRAATGSMDFDVSDGPVYGGDFTLVMRPVDESVNPAELGDPSILIEGTLSWSEPDETR